MADRLNPGDKTAAESDYDKKFNRNVAEKQQTSDADELKKRESTPDGEWKTNAKKKSKREESGKGVFGFAGKHAGAVRSGSAFGFITLIILFGLWYSSIFAPNIIMVNIKEMYTNDLADATIALDTYYKKLMNYKIGRPQCGEQESIKCKLSTMSRKQKQDFEKRGFTVVGTKVKEDNRDDGSPGNELPEERYQVMAILPPAYTSIINELKTQGISLPANLLSGNPETLAERLGNSASSFFERQTNQFSDPTQYMPIVTGDMLWLYAQISSANKAQVYGVFNPKSSFFMD